jgi:(heptosyl)LPS beta-1,4-glucosyltransferase
MVKISVVINTQNEEKNLPLAVKSIRSFADEIVVVDSGSEDKTCQVAQELGAKLYKYEEPIIYVEPARNFAISKASNEWVFLLDADERAHDTLLKKLGKIAHGDEADFVRIPRKNIIFGKWLTHSRWWPDYNIRFFKKGSVSWSEVIHSVPMTTGRGIDLAPKEKYALIHHNYKSIDGYLVRMIRYTSVQAQMRKKEQEIFKWRDILLKPSGEFFSRYFAGYGYKDGLHGLVLAILQAFSELIVCLKLWQLEKFADSNISLSDVSRELANVQKDLNYWKADAEVKQKSGIIPRIKRRFKLP